MYVFGMWARRFAIGGSIKTYIISIIGLIYYWLPCNVTRVPVTLTGGLAGPVKCNHYISVGPFSGPYLDMGGEVM